MELNVNVDDLKKILDPEYRLLKEFRAVAPGSYSHSKNVAQFSESIASELGLDSLFMNACAMYHDIGKIFNPSYFSENQQSEENPHDQLSPYVSYQLLTRHVSDTCLILINDNNIPRQLIEVVSKHHGNSVLGSIYNKVKEDISEDIFRYKSPKPDNIYSLILMICDVVEATSKSYYSNGKLETEEDKRKLIFSILERLKEDQQIDEMKVGVLRLVEDKLIRELGALYHKRVSYKEDSE